MPERGDAHWMQRALELAARGLRGASPNPMVGAVVLDAAGELAGEGFHGLSGGPHAEIVALQAAGGRAAGGCLYLTLEPCNHFGKTPPCTDAVLAAGVRRVVIAMGDPNPVAGGGIKRLQAAGVEVQLGPGAEAARRLNRRWLRWACAGRPWVTLKAAVSLDGRTATAGGESQWITSPAARRRGHLLREEHDAILVGVGTVLADDPSLGRHLALVPGRRWRRIVLDSRLRTPPTAKMIREAADEVVVVHTAQAPAARRQALEATGVTLLEMPHAEDGRPAILPLLEHLARCEIAALLVEGGGTVHGAFVDAGVVDEAVFFVAPLILGGAAPVAVAGRGVMELTTARRFYFESMVRHDVDVELRAVPLEEADVHGPG